MALFHGDEAAEKTALAILKRLGATPAAELMRNKMRAEDIRGNPRGPRAAAKRNPAGLTPRELEVLILVTEGLQNMGIATRLFVSPKAIDHQGLSDSGQAQCPAPRGSGGRCLQPRNPTATKGVFQANIGTHPDRLGAGVSRTSWLFLRLRIRSRRRRGTQVACTGSPLWRAG